MNLHDSDERRVQVIGFGLFRVKNFDRVCATGDGENGTTTEVFGELLRIKSRRSADEFEIWSTCARLFGGLLLSDRMPLPLTFQQTKEDVCCDCTLVRLIKHNNGVFRSQRIDE